MKDFRLRKLLDKTESVALLQGFAELASGSVTLGIADERDRWLVAHPAPPGDNSLPRRARREREAVADDHAVAMPIVIEGEVYGAVYASPAGLPFLPLLHRVIAMLAHKEMVRKSLARETLDRYREINLLYHIHETIGACLDLDQVVRLVLEESIRILKADGGSVLLADELTGQLRVYGSVGLDVAEAERHLIGMALSEKVFRTGKPRIINDLQHYIRPGDAAGVQLVSMLSAPFKSGEQVLGVVTLARTREGEIFTAGDEKLLSALASQAGVAILNAREVEARERKLREQIEALRIEIDEAKRQREVVAITETDYFRYLQENAQKMRADFDI